MIVHRTSICFLFFSLSLSPLHRHSLRQHMLRHAGKKYKCGLPGCPTVLRTASELRSHRSLVHDSTPSNRQYKCSDCSYAAKTKTQLRRYVENLPIRKSKLTKNPRLGLPLFVQILDEISFNVDLHIYLVIDITSRVPIFPTSGVIKNYLQKQKSFVLHSSISTLAWTVLFVTWTKLQNCDVAAINIFVSLYWSPNPIIFTLSRSEIYGVGLTVPS